MRVRSKQVTSPMKRRWSAAPREYLTALLADRHLERSWRRLSWRAKGHLSSCLLLTEARPRTTQRHERACRSCHHYNGRFQVSQQSLVTKHSVS